MDAEFWTGLYMSLQKVGPSRYDDAMLLRIQATARPAGDLFLTWELRIDATGHDSDSRGYHCRAPLRKQTCIASNTLEEDMKIEERWLYFQRLVPLEIGWKEEGKTSILGREFSPLDRVVSSMPPGRRKTTGYIIHRAPRALHYGNGATFPAEVVDDAARKSRRDNRW